MTVKRLHLGTIATFLFLVAIALPVWANGPGRGGNPAMGGPHAGGPGAIGLLGQLIFPCPSDCLNTENSCSATADSTALSCIEDACATEISTAQTDCATQRASSDCRTAVTALRECAASCLDTRATSLGDCRDALDTCRAACGSAQ